MSLADAPRILVFAGPNGSGKSSVTAAWEIIGLYINADDVKAKRDCSDLKAAQEAERLRELCLAERRSFTFETVLSTDRNLDLLTRARDAGYRIEGVFVLTASAELNVYRVKSRELDGGHSAPPDKIRSRYAKSLANISRLLALCEVFILVDNTDTPTVIFEKNAIDTKIRPNRFWTTEALEKLIGTNVTTDVLQKICKSLECDIGDIMEILTDEPNEPKSKKTGRTTKR